MQVDFMIVGAQKCGTTTLFKILNRHPSIVGCRPKEPHYFSTTADWRRDLTTYEGLFEQREGALCFEASTSYTFYPLKNLGIWDDLFAYNPRMKLIYVVRNPVDRIVSAYMHAYERGYVDVTLERAITGYPPLMIVTRYYTQIIPFVRRFGPGNVLILDFDDLVEQRTAVLQRVAAFLGVDFRRFRRYERLHSNASLRGDRKHHRTDTSRTLKALHRILPAAWNILTDNSKRLFRERPVLDLEHRRIVLSMLELEIQALQGLMKKDLSRWMLPGEESREPTLAHVASDR
jgi:hypothetical protein